LIRHCCLEQCLLSAAVWPQHRSSIPNLVLLSSHENWPTALIPPAHVTHTSAPEVTWPLQALLSLVQDGRSSWSVQMVVTQPCRTSRLADC
jgi:hypothetical protein